MTQTISMFPRRKRAGGTDDYVLVEASRAGDIDAFARLYERYSHSLRTACLKAVRDPTLADDAVQETFLWAFTHMAHFEHGRPIWPWLLRIAQHRCVDFHRRQTRAVLVGEIGTVRPGGRRGGADATIETVLAAEERARLQRALAKLPPHQRRVLLLYGLEGWNYSDIAAAEGLSLVAIKSLIFRARARLRKSYEIGISVFLFPLRTWRHVRARTLARARGETGTLLGTEASGALGWISVNQIATGLLALSLSLAGASGSPSGLSPSFQQDGTSLLASHRSAPVERRPIRIRRHTSSGKNSFNKSSVTELAEHLLDPNRDVKEPEDATIRSVHFSPNFARDRTIYAVGIGSCTYLLCPQVLFRSVDAGATWTRLAAAGLTSSQLILPPGYGQTDRRIFAFGVDGIQVSDDEGATFRNAVFIPNAELAPLAAISPAFNTGDPRIVIGGKMLTQYDDKERAASIFPWIASTAALKPAFSPSAGTEKILMVGGLEKDSVLGQVSVIYRCTGIGIVCMRSVLGRTWAPQIVFSPDFEESGVVYAFNDVLYASTDKGKSFYRMTVPNDYPPSDVASSADGALLFSTSSRLYGELYVSADKGLTWKEVKSDVLKGAHKVVAAGTYVLVTKQKGLACSIDNGSTWRPRCPSVD